MQQDVMLISMPDDALAGAGIYKGDMLMISPGAAAANGDLVAARLQGAPPHGEPFVARYFREGELIRLQPENDARLPAVAAEVTILGRVVGVMRMGIF